MRSVLACCSVAYARHEAPAARLSAAKRACGTSWSWRWHRVPRHAAIPNMPPCITIVSGPSAICPMCQLRSLLVRTKHCTLTRKFHGIFRCSLCLVSLHFHGVINDRYHYNKHSDDACSTDNSEEEEVLGPGEGERRGQEAHGGGPCGTVGEGGPCAGPVEFLGI